MREIKGNSEKELKEILINNDNCLKMKEVIINKVKLLSFYKEENGQLWFDYYNQSPLDNDDVKYDIKQRIPLSIELLKNKNISQELIDEMKNETKIIVIYDNMFYFVSKSFLKMLLLYCKVKGSFFTKTENIKETISCLSKIINNEDNEDKLNILYKENDCKIKKIISINSLKYGIIEQMNIIKIANEFPVKLYQYTISEDLTEVIYLFENEKSSLPGYEYALRIMTSDTDESSFKTDLVLLNKKNNNIIITKSVYKKHFSTFDIYSFINDIKKIIKIDEYNKKIEELNDKKLDNKVEYYILKSDITKIIGLKKVKNILKRDLKAENKKDIIFILLDIYENIFITLNKNQKENMAIFIGNQIFN